MSRSRKKPIISTTTSGARAGAMKTWKKFCNKKVRLTDDESLSKIYKRLSNPWLSPSDGKHYWDDPRARRK